MQRLCSNVLEPVREAFGTVHVSSGYRPPWLNDRIGGAPQSQPCKGLPISSYPAPPLSG